jgi:protein phosphatase
MDFAQTIQESKSVTAEGFVEVLEKAIHALRDPNGNTENLTVTGKLVKLKPVGDALVIGDLHGDLNSLYVIMAQSGFLEKLESDKLATIIFLGDYGDRGVLSPELIYCVLKLKLAFPRQVVLLRGNHEGPQGLMASPHDLPEYLQYKFKQNGGVVYEWLKELFSRLYVAVYVPERYLMVHGGLPAKLRSLQEIADAEKLHPQKTFLEELLWSDPDEQVQGIRASPRGAGYVFGKDITNKVLQNVGAQILIRGHEPADEGFKINHDAKVLTLFSRKGAPYFNTNGAYLQLPLEQKFASARQLVPFIHVF